MNTSSNSLQNYLCFCDVEERGHLGPLGRRQVLFLLELFLQLEDLAACERGPGLLFLGRLVAPALLPASFPLLLSRLRLCSGTIGTQNT